MKFLRALTIGAALAVSAPALAQNPFAYMNPQQLQIPATGADFNSLIQTLDTFFNPRFPAVQPSNATVTGGVSLSPGSSSGNAPMISTFSTTGASNVSLKIAPLGNGKIILFDSTNPIVTGILKIANNPSWVPAQGLAACPGGLKAMPTPNGGTSGVITGYLLIEDWASRVHALATC